MDTNMFQQAQQWIEQEFQGKQTVTKDQIASDAQNSSLPQDAKQAIQQVPQGDYTKDGLTAKVRDTLMSKAGGMMGGGGMGGMMGGGGQ